MPNLDHKVLLPLFAKIWLAGNLSETRDPPEDYYSFIDECFPQSSDKSKSRNVKVKLDPESASKLPFDSSKCEARTYKEGYGVQCQFVRVDGECLCTRHMNTLIKIKKECSTFDLPMGRYNSDRPTNSLDGSDRNIAWKDTRKKNTNSQKKRATAQQMRDDLSRWNISHAGLKGKKLTIRYNEELENRENLEVVSEISAETNLLPNQGEVTDKSEEQSISEDQSISEEQSIHDESKVTLQYQRNDGDNYEVDIYTTQPQDYLNNPLTKSIEKVEEKQVSTEEPKTVADYKKFYLEQGEIINKKGITLDNIKGKKQHRAKYDEIKKAIQEEKQTSPENQVNQSPQLKLEPETEPQSETEPEPEIETEPEPEIETEPEPEIEPEPEPDPETEPEPEPEPEADNQVNSQSTGSDIEDLSEEEIEYVETSFDGVDYLEVENDDTGDCDLYNLKKQKVGKWDDESTNIIWINDQFRVDHEAMIR